MPGGTGCTPARAPAWAEHDAPPAGSLRHRACWDARKDLEHGHGVAQDRDERREGVREATLAQERVEERLGFRVWIWAVVVGFDLGWETPKVEVVRTACEELVLAGDRERIVLYLRF